MSGDEMVNEREQLLVELREVNQRLTIANVRLQEQAEQLAETDRRKNEFLAMLAHELRNPLAPIRNAVDAFKAQGPLAPELQWTADILDRQVDHLRRLVDDLLDVARITRGRIQLDKRQVDVTEVLERAVETAQPLITARGHRLHVEPPTAPLWLEADPGRLAQVVTNLLTNAAKYTKEGGEIWLTVQAEGEEIVIRVRDTGMGIPAKLLPSIFEPFIQEERSLDRTQGGLGLGLTLVRQLVELHGGSVQASSAGLGQGSEFTVRLPGLKAKDQPVSPAPVHTPTYPTRRILVVDDQPDVARALTLLLKTLGHEVQAVPSGNAALSTVGTFKPEVVFLDIGLPDMDGYEVARRLRQEHPYTSLCLVALTGYEQKSEDCSSLQDVGFDHYLLKPVDIKDLQALLA